MPKSAPPAIHGLKGLKEADVRRLFEDKVFDRGVQYFEQGRVMMPCVYRDSIMAECHGTLPEDYYVRVDIRDDDLVASCTCPYAFGYCKHIAAVMYAWLKKPGMFKDLGRSENMLKRMDKGSLVETVMDMIKYDPGVAYVIDLRSLPRHELPVFVEREMRNIFSEGSVDVHEIVKKLDVFREYASDIFLNGDMGTAMVVLEPVIEAAIDQYTSLDDKDGLMQNFFTAMIDLYGDIMAGYPRADERRRFLERALEWYLLAEWGMERVLGEFLRKVSTRLKEQKFLLNAIDVRLADYKKGMIATGPKYSEEYEYIEERLERLEALRADIKGHGLSIS